MKSKPRRRLVNSAGVLSTSAKRCKLDPEDLAMNEKCAGWARETLERFQELVGTDDQDAVADLLQYLMHLSDRACDYEDFDDALKRAVSNYESFISPVLASEDRS